MVVAAPDPATQERAYRAIKGDILSGSFAPGARLEAPSLAATHNVSITPVREILYRLVGEGLVEFRLEGGFQMPMLSSERLKESYNLFESLLLLGLRTKMLEPGAASYGPTFDSPIAMPFAQIIRSTRNTTFAAALIRADEQLHVYRRAEARLFSDIEIEAERIKATVVAQDYRRAHAAICRYHRRRIRHIPALVAIAVGAMDGPLKS